MSFRIVTCQPLTIGYIRLLNLNSIHLKTPVSSHLFVVTLLRDEYLDIEIKDMMVLCEQEPPQRWKVSSGERLFNPLQLGAAMHFC